MVMVAFVVKLLSLWLLPVERGVGFFGELASEGPLHLAALCAGACVCLRSCCPVLSPWRCEETVRMARVP